jgi:hypothetical protein
MSRRRVFAGVGTAGAVAAVAAVAPALNREPAQSADTAAKPEKGGGYRLTQHVLRYYQTTRV